MLKNRLRAVSTGAALVLLTAFLVGCGAAATPRAPSPPPYEENLRMLVAQRPVPRDWVRLAREYKGLQAQVTPAAAPTAYQVGDQATFWVGRNIFNGTYARATFTLQYRNDVLYAWVENRLSWKGHAAIQTADLKTVADLFADKIYPTERELIGSEPDPGLDNDPHLYLLFTRSDGLGAYFDANDSLSPQLVYHSNLHEMIYINAPAYSPSPEGLAYLDMALAHEFTHMIHAAQNPSGEASWIGEGLANLGVELAGYPPPEDNDFTAHPGVQLNLMAQYPPDVWRAHYGAAHLFLSYLYTRFGDAFIRDVACTDTSGIATIQRALDRQEPDLTFDDVFADWTAANYLDGQLADPRYGVSGLVRDHLDAFQVAGSFSSYPARGERTVSQYGSDYLELLPAGKDVTFDFNGALTVGAIPVQAPDGQSMWWGGRNVGDARLTRSVDLRGVKSATLKFAAWYDLYDNWDFAYVSVSTDGGATWRTLRGRTTTDHNPSSLNLGNGFTCKSGVGCGKPGRTARWVQETMDLTPYAGRTVLLRFEQIAGNLSAGLAVDGIAIPEIGYVEGAEQGVSGWLAEGFARLDNRLPQHFILQAIEYRPQPRVVRIPLDDRNHASYRPGGLGRDLQRVIIVVSGSTPVSGESASYSYEIK